MIYDSLDIIPYKIFLKIEETSNVALLSDTEVEVEVLTAIWDRLLEEDEKINKTTESKKILNLSKKIDEYITTHKVVVLAVASLRFEYNEDMYTILIEKGYQLSLADTESYDSDLARIEREANAYLIKAEYYQKMLPEPKVSEEAKYNIDDVMASYSSILGYSIGKHNEITYSEFYGHEKSVNAKIDSLKNQKENSNGK